MEEGETTLLVAQKDPPPRAHEVSTTAARVGATAVGAKWPSAIGNCVAQGWGRGVGRPREGGEETTLLVARKGCTLRRTGGVQCPTRQRGWAPPPSERRGRYTDSAHTRYSRVESLAPIANELNWTDLPSDFSNFPNGDCYKSLCHFLT